ncbi:DNA mismatch repair protein [Coelomomyces lativittatus]|nr:DNA mismatch repair protein [Coelomomyces lativittatus]
MSSQPQACAGNIGTTITVQDLFYNVKSRLKALHSKSREHSYVLDVVSRYAIHNAGIAISLKKVGTNQVEINTQPNASIIDNIRMIFGNVVAKELLELNGSEENFSFSCYFTNPNFSSKKFNFLLFINSTSFF